MVGLQIHEEYHNQDMVARDNSKEALLQQQGCGGKLEALNIGLGLFSWKMERKLNVCWVT